MTVFKLLASFLAIMCISNTWGGTQVSDRSVEARLVYEQDEFEKILSGEHYPEDWRVIDLTESFVVLPQRFYSAFPPVSDYPAVHFLSDNIFDDRAASDIFGSVTFQKVSPEYWTQLTETVYRTLRKCGDEEGFECYLMTPRVQSSGLVSELIEKSIITVLKREELVITVYDDNEKLSGFIAGFFMQNIR